MNNVMEAEMIFTNYKEAKAYAKATGKKVRKDSFNVFTGKSWIVE